MKKFKIFKKKKKKVFSGTFFTKELSFPSKVYGTTGELSKSIKIINDNKPYPRVFLGVGWDVLLNSLGIQGFDASIQDIEEQSSIYEVKDLTSLSIGYRKWIQTKTQ